MKPANVLIDEQAQPFLTDFGVVKDDNARTKLTAADAAVGTLAGGDGKRLPSDNEIKIARFQGAHVAQLVNKLAR